MKYDLHITKIVFKSNILEKYQIYPFVRLLRLPQLILQTLNSHIKKTINDIQCIQ